VFPVVSHGSGFALLYPRITAGSVCESTVREKQATNREDRDTVSSELDPTLEMREKIPEEKQWRNANLEIGAWKFRLSGSAAWE
jgi:hypothetical protein